MTDPCNLPDAKEPPHCPSCSCAQGSWGDQVSSERLDELSSIRLLDVLDLRDHAARLEIQASLRELKALRERHTGIEFLFKWMRTPNPLLGSISPEQMIKLGQGHKLIQFIHDAQEDYEACSPSSSVSEQSES